jgi:iron complex outermembrane receptor protein
LFSLEKPILLSILALAALASSSSAQTPAPACISAPAQIVSGTVTDPTGAALASATVTLTCGQDASTVHTDSNGHFSARLNSSAALLQVQASGFALWQQQINPGNFAPQTIRLQIANANSSVTVSANTGFVADEASAGSKTPTDILQVPQALTIETRDQLTTQNAEDVGASLRYVPGVNGEAYGGSDQRVDWYVIRGFEDTFPLIDGMSTLTRYTLLSPKVEIEDSDSVEILRGPSSSMYGQTTPGGVVNIVTKRPRTTPLRSLTFETGSFGRVQGSGDFSGAFDPQHHFLYRLTGFARAGGTQVNYVDDNRYFLAPSFTWQPTKKTSLTLLTHLSKDDGGWTFQYLPLDGTITKSSFGIISPNMFIGDLGYNNYKRTEHSETAMLNHLFSDTVQTSLDARFTHSNVDFKNLMGAGLEADGHTLDRYVFGGNAQLNHFVSDGHIDWNVHRGHLQQSFLAGYNYMQSNDTWSEIDGVDPVTLDLLHPNYRQTFDLPAPDFISSDGVKQTGIYFQDQLRWNRLTVTLNGREDWASIWETIIPSPISTVKANKFTYRTGIGYAVTDSIVPYFSYTTSFQPPSGNFEAGVTPNPLTAEQYEAGIRYKPNSFNALFSIAAFSLTEHNVATPDPNNPNFDVETGAVRSRGLEFEAKTTLPGGIDGTASYTYTSAENTQSNDPTILDKAPLDVPRNMANLWADKTFQQGTLAHFGFGGGVRFVGKRFGDQQNEFQVPNNTLVDAVAHYNYRNFKLSANVTNLGNRRYVATCENETRCVYGGVRTVFANLNYHW